MTTYIKNLFFLLAIAALLSNCQQVSGECDYMRTVDGKNAPVMTERGINLSRAFTQLLKSSDASKIRILNAKDITNELIQCELAYNNSIFGKAIYDPLDGGHYALVTTKFTFRVVQNPQTKEWTIVDQGALQKFITLCNNVDEEISNLSEEELIKIAAEYPQADIKACNNLNLVIGISKESEEPVLGWLLNYKNTTTIQLLPTQSITPTEYERVYHNLAGGIDFSSGDSADII